MLTIEKYAGRVTPSLLRHYVRILLFLNKKYDNMGLMGANSPETWVRKVRDTSQLHRESILSERSCNVGLQLRKSNR